MSATVAREVEWDEEQQALMLALHLYRAQTCSSGHWLPESGAPANEDRYRGISTRCHACTATAIEVARLKENPHPSALLYGVELRR